ncbi:MAG: hypothetical protein ACXWUL_04980 [Caldimonas sp.]
MKARALVKDRAQRNLLLLIDGRRSDEKLLSDLAGISPADFAALAELGLIAPVGPATPPMPMPPPAAEPATRPGQGAGVDAFDYAALRGAIGRSISKQLGMRGFALLMVLEDCNTVDDLKDVAQRLLKAVADRKGMAAAEQVSKELFG